MSFQTTFAREHLNLSSKSHPCVDSIPPSSQQDGMGRQCGPHLYVVEQVSRQCRGRFGPKYFLGRTRKRFHGVIDFVPNENDLICHLLVALCQS